MSKTIYVITAGTYSDYHICGVYDDKEKAQKFIDSFGKDRWSEMGIEEFTLNPYELEVSEGLKPCFIRISKEGNTSDFNIEDNTYGFINDDEGGIGFDIKNDMYVHCFARDEAHAIKIASEKRAYYLANDLWRKLKNNL